MFEIANGITLLFLGAKEGDSCLGRHGSSHDRFGSGDKDKSIAFGFPCKVDDGVLDRIDDFYRYTLFFDAEDLQICG